MGITKPAPLSPEHVLDQFCSGEPSIDNWLRQHARANEATGGSRTIVVCDNNLSVVGFYALSSSVVARVDVKRKHAKGMPKDIPVILLGQLGVDQVYQRRGIAKGLVKDAVIRTLATSRKVGVAALVVDALTDALIPFYEAFGFDTYKKSDPHFMGIPVKDLEALLAQ